LKEKPIHFLFPGTLLDGCGFDSFAEGLHKPFCLGVSFGP
jgi:hypothetical protein